MIVGENRLDQEPGARDGNDGDEPDRPDTAQAMEVAPEDAGALADAQAWLEEPFPESFVDHQAGDQRGQHRQAEQRNQVPAPTVAIVERNQPPAVQGTGELAEIEVRALALDRSGIGVDVEAGAGAVRVADPGAEGKMLFVGEVQRFHADRRLCLVYRFQQLVVAEGAGVVAGLAGTDFRIGEPDDLLADHCQGAGDADDQDEEPDGQGQPAVDEEPESGAGLFRHEANGRLWGHACGPWVAGRCSRSVHLYRTYEPERT